MSLQHSAILGHVYNKIRYLPYMVALVAIVFIVWAAGTLIGYPNEGIYVIQPDGEISALLLDGPATGKLLPGDIITRIENIEWNGILTYYPDLGKNTGDTVNFQVQRDGRLISVPVTLVRPSLSQVLDRLVPLLVALFFALVGLGMIAFRPVRRFEDPSFYWFQISSIALTAGALSTLGITWTSTLFNCLLWLIGPLSVHFHMYFPEAIERPKLRGLLAGLYVLAAIGILPYILYDPVELASTWWFAALFSAGRLYLGINLILVVAILIHSYRHVSLPGARGKIRLVLLGSGLVALSFLSLTILPDILLQQPFIPYSFAFLVLIFLPMTYGYAIFRLNFIEIEKQINRGATYIIVYSIIGGIYMVLYAAIIRVFSPVTARSELVNTILVLILASVYFPLHGRVQRMVDRVFYGGWYDYRLGVSLITHGLEQINDLRELGKTITRRLERTLRLEEAVVFFRDQTGDFSVIEVSFARPLDDHSARIFPVLPRSSLTYLLKLGVVERQTLIRQLEQVTLSPEELQLLNSEQIHLWVPAIGHGQIQGLLALGPKLGGDVFSVDDLDILRMVVQQLSPMIENIHLVTRLKNYAVELEQRVEERTTELYDAKERVEAILASVGDGVIVTDLSYQIQRVNTSFEGLTGFAAEEVIDRNLFSLLSDEDHPAQIAAIRTALANDQSWSGELAGRRQDASRFAVQFNIAPVHDRSGQVVSYVGTLTDITRKKELDRMKDMFISDVSHELRTPITNIRLYIELLNSATVQNQKRYLNVIKDQSEVLTKLVEDILDLSRLNIMKVRQVTFADLDLNSLAAQVVTAHVPLAEANGLRLMLDPAQNIPLIRGEQNQIARMITNLVTNAIRYTSQGAICVRTMLQDGGVCLEVEDTGIGIDKQDIPHLYERFYRGSNVRQSEIHGTGLGLAIVKEISDLHDGRIEVDSVPGQGSTFRVWLPITSIEET